MKLLNDPRPWWGMLRGAPMSVRELLANGTLDAHTAATLGWTLEHGASLFVAGGPPGAGKSTLATALLEFLPEDAQLYVTYGPRDPLEVPVAGDNGPVYLLVNELSYHMPLYLSGRAAQRAFWLLQDGVRMLGTLHARSAREAVAVLCDEAYVERSALATPFVFVALSAGWKDGRVERRVSEVGFLVSGAAELVQLGAEAGVAALAAWQDVDADRVVADIEVRAAALGA